MKGPPVFVEVAALPLENVYGHTKKLKLLLEDLSALRSRTGRPLRILDLGCGNGSAVTRFLDSAGNRVLGIDSHRPSIEWARAHYASHTLEFEVAAAEAIPGDFRADAVVLADVLEHLEEPGRTLRLAADRLAADGRALVSVPNGFGPFETESWLSRLPGIGWLGLKAAGGVARLLYGFRAPRAPSSSQALEESPPYNDDSGHVQFFTFRRFVTMATEAGLQLDRWCRLSWLCGPYTNTLLGQSRRFCELNVRVADRLPGWAVSAWYFCLRRAPESPLA